MNGFDLTKVVENEPTVKITRTYCKLSHGYKYTLSSLYLFGELRTGINGEWNWFLRNRHKVVLKGNGSFNNCMAQIKSL